MAALVAALATAGCGMVPDGASDFFEKSSPSNRLARADELYDRGSYFSLVQAHKEYGRLAREGNAEAQYKLGRMYAEGKGAPQDHAESAARYRDAAGQGHAGAQYELAVMNHEGVGVSKDNVQAHSWATLAVANSTGASQENAVSLREDITAEMTPAELSKSQRMARRQKPELVVETPSTIEAAMLNRLALFYHKQSRYTEAEVFFKRALAIRVKSLGTEHLLVAQSLENYADLLAVTKRAPEAKMMRTRAKVIRAKHPQAN
jgi:TPR repeat protein